MRGQTAALALGVMVLASSVSRSASAGDARTSSLSWLRMPGTDTCIATQALARSVEERLGRHVFVSAAEADVSVEGRIEKRAAAWHAVITIRDSKGALLGTRELDRPDRSCESMNDPLALVIAVMIDPDAKLGDKPTPLPPVPVPVPVPVPAPATPPPSDTVTPPPPPPRDPWRFEGDVHGAILGGIAPQVALGAGVSGIVFLPGIPIGLRGYGNLYLPTTAEKDGAQASFDLVYLGSALCPTLRGKFATGMLCFGGHLGVLRSHAETQGRDIDDRTSIVWNAVTEGRVSIPLLAPVALTAGVSAVLPLLRPTFEYTSEKPVVGRDNLHKVSSFAFAADAGIGFFFP